MDWIEHIVFASPAATIPAALAIPAAVLATIPAALAIPAVLATIPATVAAIPAALARGNNCICSVDSLWIIMQKGIVANAIPLL